MIQAIPIILGLIAGAFLSWQVLVALTAIGVVLSAVALYTTRNAELGALAGVIVAAVSAYFLIPMWLAFVLSSGLISGPNGHIDLSWMFRT